MTCPNARLTLRPGNAVGLKLSPTKPRALTLRQGLPGKDGDSPSLTFETVSKNLKAYPSTLAYTSGVLTSISYATPAGAVVKTLNYTAGKLTSITLSGVGLPDGIQTTKTLVYAGETLTGVSYS